MKIHVINSQNSSNNKEKVKRNIQDCILHFCSKKLVRTVSYDLALRLNGGLRSIGQHMNALNENWPGKRTHGRTCPVEWVYGDQ